MTERKSVSKTYLPTPGLKVRIELSGPQGCGKSHLRKELETLLAGRFTTAGSTELTNGGMCFESTRVPSEFPNSALGIYVSNTGDFPE